MTMTTTMMMKAKGNTVDVVLHRVLNFCLFYSKRPEPVGEVRPGERTRLKTHTGLLSGRQAGKQSYRKGSRA